MGTLIQILIIISAILILVGFIGTTFGLFRSFSLDRFNRFVYLGLAVICTGALVAALSAGVTYVQVRSIVNDINASSETSQVEDTATYEAPEYEEPADTVPEESTVSDEVVDTSEDSGVWVDDGMYPEELVEFANTYSDGEAECVQSGEAESDAAFYLIEYPENILQGETYLVPLSDSEVLVSVGIHEDENAVLYVNSVTYEMFSVNDTATHYSYFGSAEELGVDSVSIESSDLLVAESCGM